VSGVGCSELPVGLQITGPALGEQTILRAAYAFEQATPWHERIPAIDEEHGK
jgi:aspartyl-tRNA(Asn)/glutamyl-tRNA(Gln) amidotransferase subunit A